MASSGGKSRIQYGIAAEVGLANGGLLRQSIRKDYYGLAVCDQDQIVRCYVHLLNSEQNLAVTGEPYPSRPFSAQDYAQRGLHWFHAYHEGVKKTPASNALSCCRIESLRQIFYRHCASVRTQRHWRLSFSFPRISRPRQLPSALK